ELVPQGRGRAVPLARLQRQHAHPAVDRGSRPGTRTDARVGTRLDAALSGHRLARTGLSARDVRAGAGTRRGGVAARSHRARGAVPGTALAPAERDDLRARAADLSSVRREGRWAVRPSPLD